MKIKKLLFFMIIILVMISIFPIIIMSTALIPRAVEHNEEILNKVKTLQTYAEEYKAQSNSSTSVTELCMQYIRNGKYSGGLWETLLGEVETNFINYVKAKENVPNFGNDVLLDPITNQDIDFVHLIAPLNTYIKHKSGTVMSISVDYAGWAGDAITLLEQVTKYRTNNQITDKQKLQEYSNSMMGTNKTGTTFPTEDMLADLDAKALYKDSSNSLNSDFYNALYKYYVSCDSTYNATNRLETSKTILGSSKSAVKEAAKDILPGNMLTDMVIKKLFSDESLFDKVSSDDIDVVSQSFANYIYKDPQYFKLNESSGTATVGAGAIKVKIIDSHTNLANASVEVGNSKIATAEIEGEYVKITPLDGGTTQITVYSEGKTLNSTYEFTAKNVAPTITKDLEESYELTLDEEYTFSVNANGTNNTYIWYIKNSSDGQFNKVAESAQNTYKVVPTKEMNNTYIKCGVKNSGNNEVYSKVAKITIYEPCEHEFVWASDNTQHWKKCSKCNEEQEGTRESHEGVSHQSEGKCTACGHQCETHSKSTKIKGYTEKTETTHTILYECTLEGCTETYKGETQNHSVETWSNKNKDEHSGKCEVCGDEATQKHNYNEEGLCTECNARIPQEECEHNYSLQSDNTEHWKKCSKCEKEIERANHEGATHPEGICIKCEHKYETHSKSTKIKGYTEKTETTHTILYKCTLEGCTETYKGETQNHSVETWSNKNKDEHSGKCEVCGDEATQKHNYNEEGLCTECNAKIPQEECEHNYRLQSDNTEHWKKCSKCEKEIERANHEGATHPDGKCIKCDRKYETHSQSTEIEEYIDNKTDATHTLVYSCTLEGCTGTYKGEVQKHNIIEFKDTDEGVHIGKCKDCEYELTQEHTYNEEGLCIKCNAQIPEEECEHIYKQQINETHHWKVCFRCKGVEKDSLKEHKYDKYIQNEDSKTHSGNCVECEYQLKEEHNYGEDGLCTKCNVRIPKEQCTHSYVIKNDDKEHWEQCILCLDIKDISKDKHIYMNFTDNKDGTHSSICEECEYKITEKHTYREPNCSGCIKPEITPDKEDKEDNVENKDDTMAKDEIPNTGKQSYILIAIFFLCIILVIAKRKLNKYKDI